MDKAYYKAYDDRYRQIHQKNLQWFGKQPSPIVAQVMARYRIGQKQTCLEIGCGEGRDAIALLEKGFDLTATDVSPAAIQFCQTRFASYADRFSQLDCITDRLPAKYDFIYAVAVIHMLVPDNDRDAFYGFMREQLSDCGIGLICSMGDGTEERQTDIQNAFTLQDRIHEPSGTAVRIASTSCRMVSFPSLETELARNGLTLISKGLTSVPPDFPQMMYAVVKRQRPE